LRDLRADVALVMAYGHILRQDWIDAVPRGIWNLHASLLPKYRGASPIQGAIVGGESASGVCLMRLVLALDAGPVLDREPVAIGPHDTGAILEEKLAAACVPLMRRGLATLLADEPRLEAQDDAAATFTRRLCKEDGRLDFRAPAALLARRINGLFPWPGAFFEIGGETIKAGLAEAAETGMPAGEAPGTAAAGRDALVIATGAGTLRILRLQRPGGRMLPAADFLRGHPIAPGTVIASSAMPELVSRRPIKG
jgi:methionyl-tRNA formyltransferase